LNIGNKKDKKIKEKGQRTKGQKPKKVENIHYPIPKSTA
jgi:hypothetical protein